MNELIKKTTAVAPVTKPSALNLMASRLSCDATKLLATLKATVFKGANDEEVMALVVVSNEYQLNPLLKEMYAFPAKGGGIVPIVSVDGWNKMLIRQPDFDGIEFDFEHGENTAVPHSCTATIYVKNRSKPVKITEYYDECYRKTDNWEHMPHRMLRNRTLCQASRMAFGFSGIHHEEEANTITVESSVMPSEPPPKLVAAPPTTTAQTELEAFVTAEGFTFDHLQKFGIETGNISNADSLATFGEIPTDEAKRLLKAKAGLLTALKNIKGAQ